MRHEQNALPHIHGTFKARSASIRTQLFDFYQEISLRYTPSDITMEVALKILSREALIIETTLKNSLSSDDDDYVASLCEILLDQNEAASRVMDRALEFQDQYYPGQASPQP